jgi:hypothetical protein
VLAPNPSLAQSNNSTPPLRHRCRNTHCGCKLPVPTDNPRNAFCTRTCFTVYFRNRCLVCERSFKRIRDGQMVCERRPCKNALQSDREHFFGKWARVPANVLECGENPTKPGVKTRSKPDRPYRKITGPDLSPTAFRFATLPFDLLPSTSKAYAELLDDRRKAKRRAQRHALLKYQHPPVNVLGGYVFPGAPTVDLSPTGEPLPPVVESVGLDVPEFLRRAP